MPHVEFTAPFDWTPPERPRVTVAYPVGFYTVTRDCADKAVAAGKARRVKAPKRGDNGPSKKPAGAAQVSTPDHD